MMGRYRPTGDDFMEAYDDTFIREFAARTVHESEELVDIGIVDEQGNKVMAKARKPRIGFKWRD